MFGIGALETIGNAIDWLSANWFVVFGIALLVLIIGVMAWLLL